MPSVSETVERLLVELTPGHLRRIVEDLSRAQAPDNREGVPIGSIIDVITEGRELGEGSEWWEATLTLQRGVREVVAHIEGLRYIEVDS